MKKTLIIMMALLFSVAGSLQAASITNTAAVTMNPLQDATVYLSKFDSSLGTLTGIYIEFTMALYNYEIQFDNDLTVQKKPTVSLSSDVRSFFSSVDLAGTGISPDGSDLSLFDFKQFVLAANVGDSVDQFDVGGADYGIWFPEPISSIGGYVDSGVFADYIGSGTFSVTINSDFGAAISTWTGVRYEEISPDGELSATVVYDYAAIPEPAVIGLIGLGGIITLTVSRIRRRK